MSKEDCVVLKEHVCVRMGSPHKQLAERQIVIRPSAEPGFVMRLRQMRGRRRQTHVSVDKNTRLAPTRDREAFQAIVERRLFAWRSRHSDSPSANPLTTAMFRARQ